MIPKKLIQDSSKYNYLPINYQISGKLIDLDNLMKFYKDQKIPCFVLNKTEQNNTTIVVRPKKVFKGKNGEIKVFEANKLVETLRENPIEYFELLMNKYKTPKYNNLFTTGLVGYFSYEFVKYIKNNKLKNSDNQDNLADFELFLPDIVINYDENNQKINLSYLLKSNELHLKYAKVIDYLKMYANEILKKKAFNLEEFQIEDKFTNQFNYEQFGQKLDKAKMRIRQGDIFQLILSNPYYLKAKGHLVGIFNYLNKNIEAPYKFYFNNDNFEAVGASPETLIKKINNDLYSYPLAGTRKRGEDYKRDQKLANELQNNVKETSEHNMLVDLGRNDLGKISQMGTVKVTKLRELIKYSNVMHLGSEIRSKSLNNISPIKIVSEVLPAGTLSGAPKVSAMNIINELENNKRGIYGGGIGYLDFDGDLDLCIGIRLAYKKQNRLVVRSGAGIVSDSEITKEYKEFQNKSKLMLDAINCSRKGDFVDDSIY